jgi:hypothetical protein
LFSLMLVISVLFLTAFIIFSCQIYQMLKRERKID